MAITSDDQGKAAIERARGIKVLDVRRQARWRPAWFFDGGARPLVVLFHRRTLRNPTLMRPPGSKMAEQLTCQLFDADVAPNPAVDA